MRREGGRHARWDRPVVKGAPRHGKRYDARRRRLQNAGVGLGGLVVLLLGLVLLLGTLPGAVAEERAYLAASPCRAAGTRDCVRAGSFTVESVTLRRGKNERGRVQVVGAHEGRQDLEFHGIGPFLERLRPGDRVTGTIWRGRVVVLADAGGAQRTTAHPVGDPLFGAAFGIMLVLAGGLGTYAAWWWIRHPAHSVRRHPPALVRAAWSATLLGIHAFVLMAVLYERDIGLGVFLSLWAPAFCAAVVFLLRPRRGHPSAPSIR